MVVMEPEIETDPGARYGTATMGDQVGEQRTHPLLGELDAARAQVRAGATTAMWALSDADLETAIAQCEQLRAQVHFLELGLIAEADGRALGTRLGSASTIAWLRHRFRIRPGHAKSLVHTATAVDPGDQTLDYGANVSSRSGRELKKTGAALAEGAISPEHAATVDKIMAKVPREVDVEQAVQAESDLAGFCREFDPGTVAKLGDYMLEMMRTDTLDDDDQHRHHHRTLRLDDHTGGISGQLTREGMALLRSALDPLATPNPSDNGERDLRTPGQRLADALVELARRAMASDEFATNHGMSHRVMVSVGLESLIAADSAAGVQQPTQPGVSEPTRDVGATSGEADECGPGEPASDGARDDGSPVGWWVDRSLPNWAVAGTGHGVAPARLEWGSLISAGTALRMACHASVQRVVLDPNGAVLDVGRERRTVTPAQYAALIARDGGCAFPGCTRPPAWCIAHHIKHWAHGGATDLDNLVMLCGHHHRVIHHHGWQVYIDSIDRLPTFLPPRWVDVDQRPRRNKRARMPDVGRGPRAGRPRNL